MDARYRSSEILVKRLVERSAAKEVLKTMEDYAKRSWAGLQRGVAEHNTRKWKLSLPNSFVPVTKLQLNSLELEKQEMKLNICAFNSELAEAKKMLADNQPLFNAGAQLYRLNPINKRPP